MGLFWVCFGSVSGPFRGVGWGRGEVGERGLCKGKEYHERSISRTAGSFGLQSYAWCTQRATKVQGMAGRHPPLGT